MKHVIILLSCLLFTGNTLFAQTYSGGSGNQSDPYRISSKEDLEALSAAVKGGNAYAGKYFILMADAITLSTSIGSPITPFSGIFDGNGYKIYLNNTANGVFEYLLEAKIQNLVVTGTVSAPATALNNSVGGICGLAVRSAVNYCYNSAAISSKATHSRAGGICGSSDSIISNCYNSGNITVETAQSYAGGICGYLGNISNCYNRGRTVTGTWAGGIGGRPAVVTNSFSTYPGGINSRGISGIGGVLINTCYSELPGDYERDEAKDGAPADESDFQTETWIKDLGWDVGGGVWKVSNESYPVLADPQLTITVSSNSNPSLSLLSLTNFTVSHHNNVTVNRGNSLPITYTIPPSSILSPEDIKITVDGETVEPTDDNTYTFQNITANHSITINSCVNITVSCTGNGSVSPEGSFWAPVGSSPTIYFMPNKYGAKIEGFLNDDRLDDFTEQGYYTLDPVSDDTEIVVNFGEEGNDSLFIAAWAGPGGRLLSPDSTYSTYKDPLEFSVEPNAGYELDQIIHNDTAVTEGIISYGDTLYVYPLHNNTQTILATFKRKQYTVTTTSGTGGSVTPKTILVSHGDSATFIFDPIPNYEVKTVTVVTVGGDTVEEVKTAANSYTYSVTDSSEVKVVFGPKNDTVFATVERGSGTISFKDDSVSGSVLVDHESQPRFTFKPDPGFAIDTVKVNGEVSDSTSSYTFPSVLGTQRITVSFIRMDTITASVTNRVGGSISPTGSVAVRQGSNQTFTFTPNTGYTIDTVKVDGSPVRITSNTYTFSNVTESHSITVSFREMYTIAASVADPNTGSIRPSGQVRVPDNSDTTFTFIPNAHYEIDSVAVDNKRVTLLTDNTYKISKVSKNYTIQVAFKHIQYPVTGTVNESKSGTIRVDTNKVDKIYTFTATPSIGKKVYEWRVNDVIVADSTVNTYSLRWDAMQGPTTVQVVFGTGDCLPDIVIQVWDDVLAVINNPDYNKGFVFKSYQWQKNGVNLPGDTLGTLYLGGNLDYTAEYTCLLTDTNDNELPPTCPVKLKQTTTTTANAYPNPTQGFVTIRSDEMKAGDWIEIRNAAGAIVDRRPATAGATTLNISSLPAGIYLLNVNGKQVKVMKE